MPVRSCSRAWNSASHWCARGGGVAQLVQLRVVALADQAAVLDGDRRLVDDRALDQFHQVCGRGVICSGEVGDQRRGVVAQVCSFERGQGRERDAEAHAGRARCRVPAPSRAISRSRSLTCASASRRSLSSRRSLTSASTASCRRPDSVRLGQRPQHPVAQQAPAHGGARGVEHAEQRDRRCPPRAAPAGGHEVEVGDGGLVEQHVVGGFRPRSWRTWPTCRRSSWVT